VINTDANITQTFVEWLQLFGHDTHSRIYKNGVISTLRVNTFFVTTNN